MARPFENPQQGLFPPQTTKFPSMRNADGEQGATEPVEPRRLNPTNSPVTTLYSRPLPAFGEPGRFTPMGAPVSSAFRPSLPPMGNPGQFSFSYPAPFATNDFRSLGTEGTQATGMKQETPDNNSPTISSASATRGNDEPEERESNRDQDYLRLVHGGKDDLQQISDTGTGSASNASTTLEEVKTTPLFSGQVLSGLRRGDIANLAGQGEAAVFPQYGLLAARTETYPRSDASSMHLSPTSENLVFSNMNAPWSAFMCGSQGAGKSHSLTCLLENCLLSDSPAAHNPKPLAGLVFHYDRFSGDASTQLCEAAYLCTAGIPVRILVSPSNFRAMHKLYSNLPGLPDNAMKPKVIPLRIQQQQLDVTRIMTMMAMNDKGQSPLYMEVLYQILRDLAIQNNGSGVDYLSFKTRLEGQGFQGGQNGPLRLRLQLLESFLAHPDQSVEAQDLLDGIFTSTQGTLTIVDLSCPFVNENDACALFTICLSLFMEKRGDCGRVIALDEAHKFLTKSGEAEKLTDQLISIIRQQRHLGSRVIIATQEPTLAPTLLDLCNVSIVHRFNSPAWFRVLKEHLAGASFSSGHYGEELFQTIVGLQTGQALMFCPTASFDVDNGVVRRLGSAYIKVKIRSRVTFDGGRSIMASDGAGAIAVGGPVSANIVRPFNAPNSQPRSNGPGLGMVTGASRLRTATATSASTGAHVSGHSGNAPARAGGPPAPTRTPATVNADAEACLRAEVTNSLHRDAHSLGFNRVRTVAATRAGLPASFFDKAEWKRKSSRIIHDQIDKHTAAYHIPKPLCG
ncbi:hypothetical protein PV11_08127 [Exophiala sideris]|uniref:Zona occludens toxin N-terminal domain-containing protein n=1 Tax=Exophiala sideris TaxID=1016849 RepID=A0A0D1YHY0_9EURO|nr:hypothetical protein PV11_08127 [Exophiala sideris]